MSIERSEGREIGAFDDLATGLSGGTITRGRAIKLAGAALAGSALSLFFAPDAEARKKKKKKKKKKRGGGNSPKARCKKRGRRFCKGRLGTSCCPDGVASAACSLGVCVEP